MERIEARQNLVTGGSDGNSRNHDGRSRPWRNITGDLVLTATGVLEPFLGGIISNTVVTDGGKTFVIDGGIAIGTTVVSGGSVAGAVQEVEGLVAGMTATAIDTLVGAGGTEFSVFRRGDLRSDRIEGRV